LNNYSGIPKTKINLKNEFKSVDKNLIDMVQKMLEINPNIRATASELLTSAYFNEVRNSKQGAEPTKKVVIPLDQDFNYETQRYSSKTICDLERHLFS